MIPSVLYVILTCDKYSSRKKLQQSTWLNYIGKSDLYVYLEDDGLKEIVYTDLALKYINFIKSFKESRKYDWLFFCDDDTFCYPKKLGWLLRFYDPQKHFIIGRKGVYNGWELCSGGAGFAVSQSLYEVVSNFVYLNDVDILPNTDTSFGMWAKLASDSLCVLDIPNQFQTQHPRHDDNSEMDIDSIITMHYCEEQDFKTLSRYLKHNIN